MTKEMYTISTQTPQRPGLPAHFKQSLRLLLLTDVRGLLRDPKDESTLIPELQLSSVPALEREGVISGGMIPKVDCCKDAIRRGVNRVFILDGRVPHSILIEIFTDAGLGTMFVGG